MNRPYSLFHSPFTSHAYPRMGGSYSSSCKSIEKWLIVFFICWCSTIHLARAHVINYRSGSSEGTINAQEPQVESLQNIVRINKGIIRLQGNTPVPSIIRYPYKHLPRGKYTLSLKSQAWHTGVAPDVNIKLKSDEHEAVIDLNLPKGLALTHELSLVCKSGNLTIEMIYDSHENNAKVTLEKFTLSRNRAQATEKLTFAGVTPYTPMDWRCTDHKGLKFDNFTSLSHRYGANAVRLGYVCGENHQTFFQKADLAQRLGMKVIVSLYPPKTFKRSNMISKETTRACREAILKMTDMGISPDLLLIGNEINTAHGFLNQDVNWSSETVFFETTALSIKAATLGVREAGYTGPLSLHIDRSWPEFFTKIREHGIDDLQVASISCYPKWGDMNTDLRTKLESMKSVLHKEDLQLLVLETGSPYMNKTHWKTQDFSKELVAEVSPLGQLWHLEYLAELLIEIHDKRALGIIHWGSDLTHGVHEWSKVTWNRALVTESRVALPSMAFFKDYAK